jgi:hypothetical protein
VLSVNFGGRSAISVRSSRALEEQDFTCGDRSFSIIPFQKDYSHQKVWQRQSRSSSSFSSSNPKQIVSGPLFRFRSRSMSSQGHSICIAWFPSRCCL